MFKDVSSIPGRLRDGLDWSTNQPVASSCFGIQWSKRINGLLR
jgi:hypothetical protein